MRICVLMTSLACAGCPSATVVDPDAALDAGGADAASFEDAATEDAGSIEDAGAIEDAGSIEDAAADAGPLALSCPAYPPPSACPVLTATLTYSSTVVLARNQFISGHRLSASAGPNGGAAVIWSAAGDEVLLRVDSSGAPVGGLLRLQALNPAIRTSSLGDSLPALYRPRIAFDGARFGVVRRSASTSDPVSYFFVVDPDGALVAGPLVLRAPVAVGDTPNFAGAAVTFDRGRFFVAFGVEVDLQSGRIFVAAVRPDATLDRSFGQDGFVEVFVRGSRAALDPNLVVSSDGALAGLSWGSLGGGFAVIDLASFVTRAAGQCPSLGGGAAGPPAITWNPVLGEFALALYGNGPAIPTVGVQSVLLRFDASGVRGAPTAVHCGSAIGAQLAGGLLVEPDGSYRMSASPWRTPGVGTSVVTRRIDSAGVVTAGPASGPTSDYALSELVRLGSGEVCAFANFDVERSPAIVCLLD